jgi:predicted metal-dependent hydrolase
MEIKNCQIKFGDSTILYQLIVKNNKNITIRVNQYGNVLVSAPEKLPEDMVIDYVQSKASWIYRNLEEFKKKQSVAVPKEYVSGESFHLLGKQYRLKVIQWDKDHICVDDDYIKLYTRHIESVEKREGQYFTWLREQAKTEFFNALDRMYPLLGKYGYAKPELAIRSMRTRWGSCVPIKQKIWLNLHLIKAPVYCIDYVMLHELCHLKYQNHNRNFYDLLTVLMPEWKERKKILESIACLEM